MQDQKRGLLRTPIHIQICFCNNWEVTSDIYNFITFKQDINSRSYHSHTELACANLRINIRTVNDKNQDTYILERGTRHVL